MTLPEFKRYVGKRKRSNALFALCVSIVMCCVFWFEYEHLTVVSMFSLLVLLLVFLVAIKNVIQLKSVEGALHQNPSDFLNSDGHVSSKELELIIGSIYFL